MEFQERAESLSKEEIAELLRRSAELDSVNAELLASNDELRCMCAESKSTIAALRTEKAELSRQLEWFKRQVFGQKSEQRPKFDARQLCLGESLSISEDAPPPNETIKEYERRLRRKPWDTGEEDRSFRFDSSVPVKVVEVPTPELEGLSEHQYEIVADKVTYRLAQRPGSYVVLKYVRKVIKLNDEISCPPAPPSVIERSFADVSFLAGLMIEKFCYHLPLYRQHQRLQQAGVRVSRGTLTNLVHRSAEILEPIYFALLSSILQSEVLLMDETPIKAGRKSKGKMGTGYFWPLYGDKEEIVFPFAASRALEVARGALGSFCGVLVTDGYKVYEKYSEAAGSVIHAQCWAHTRRKFIEAEGVEPELSATALNYIGELYRLEKALREKTADDEQVLACRYENSRSIVEKFFAWLERVAGERALLPSNPFTKAAKYALEREKALRVFLEHPNVPLDTNDLERQIRPVAIGRKNYLFCWTEVGARYAGIIYSLIASCRLQGIDPHTYLVDVLQRIDCHSSFEVQELTPRLWKAKFAGNPMRSDLDVKGVAD